MQTNLWASMVVVLGMALTPAATLASGEHKDHAHDEKHAEKHEDGDHSDHKSELKGMKALHAWTQAVHKGDDALVFVELENGSNATITFLGGEAKHAKSVELVGFQLKEGEPNYVPVTQVPIKAGRHLELAPKSLALRLHDLDEDLHKGETIEMELEFDIGHMEIHVEIGSKDATQHSHAGHNHD